MTDIIIKGESVIIDPTSSVNNVIIGDNVKIAKLCSVFGSKDNPVKIGKDSYIGMMSIVNGFKAQLTIGENVSIAQKVNIMTDSGPNASKKMQSIFPIKTGPILIEDHTWIGANSIIMPNITIGKCSIIGANSFVTKSFPEYSIIAGSPARLIRKLTLEEIKTLEEYDKIS